MTCTEKNALGNQTYENKRAVNELMHVTLLSNRANNTLSVVQVNTIDCSQQNHKLRIYNTQ